MGSYRFLLSGGGTGGHIFPAISIADELKKRYPEASFLFVGARDRMEMEKVPLAGYEIKGLWISGIQRKINLKNLLFPLKLIKSMWDARKIIRSFQPDLVIGTGGFASGPTLRVAAARGIPCAIQEQNSYAGITNKWLASKAARIFVAYPNMDRFFPKERIVFTGNPVREGISKSPLNAGEARSKLGLVEDKPLCLILGGSLGSRRINEHIAEQLAFFSEEGFQILWQCGKGYYQQYRHLENEGVLVRDFIRDMHTAFSAADIIISRAGAGTVSELCLVGKAVIFIPSPNVAEDHQRKNAAAIVAQGAAFMIEEKDLDKEFQQQFKALSASSERRNTLGETLKSLAKPKATEHIVNELEKLLN